MGWALLGNATLGSICKQEINSKKNLFNLFVYSYNYKIKNCCEKLSGSWPCREETSLGEDCPSLPARRECSVSLIRVKLGFVGEGVLARCWGPNICPSTRSQSCSGRITPKTGTNGHGRGRGMQLPAIQSTLWKWSLFNLYNLRRPLIYNIDNEVLLQRLTYISYSSHALQPSLLT